MVSVTMKNVELLKVGDWSASEGNGKVLPEDITAMVAAYRNPMADRIPIKIGHTDPRFQDANGNPPADHDGHPAYGWVENVRASVDGRTLLGDLVGIPPKLGEAMPSAFRSRSVEFFPGRRIGGTVYRAVLTAVALLGSAAPAVKGLEDVLALYSQGQVVTLSERPREDPSLEIWASSRERARRSFLPGNSVPSQLPPPAQVFGSGSEKTAADEEFHRRAMATFFPRPM